MRAPGLARANVLAVVLAAACASARPEGAMMPSTGVVVVTSGARCSSDQAALPAALFVTEQDTLEKVFGIKSNPPPRMRPTVSSVKNAIKSSSDARGFLMVYSGHGSKPRDAGTELCMIGEDDVTPAPVAASSLFSEIRESTWGVFLINSCFSGYVDIRQAHLPAAVLTVSHGEIDALHNGPTIEGTTIGKMLAEIVSRRDDGPDWNCDGIVTDYELFGHLMNGLQFWASKLGAHSPVFNLRRQARSHIPIALDGEPAHSKACDPDTVKRAVTEIRDSLRQDASPNSAQEELANLLEAQQNLAAQLRRSAGPREQTALSALEWRHGDLYVIDPPDPDLELRLASTGLAPFPFARANPAARLAAARTIADFVVSLEIYRFEAVGPDAVRVTELRRKVTRSQPGDQLAEAGSLMGNWRRDEVPALARQLARGVRVMSRDPVNVLGQEMRGATIYCRGAVPDGPQAIEDRGETLMLMPQTWVAIPCEGGVEGQCFLQPTRVARGAR